MSGWPILTVALGREVDVVAVRQRARRIAELVGFGMQDQTRIATAVSEIARNAVVYSGRGRAEFALSGADAPQRLVIRVSDQGPGIRDLEAILSGRYQSPTGLGLGILGARRLMDKFELDSAPGRGTTVTLEKTLPKTVLSVAQSALSDLSRRLAADAVGDPLAELRAQNQELLRSLADLKGQQDEATRLNEELDHTNKGVVALYAELDQKATELQALNASLKERIATAIAERERVEENLRQSQKMEAVGQLTGGIAHDFNNLLQIVTGNLEILGRNLPEEAGRLRRATDNAMRGAQRAAILTQRLLAFSRRQPLAPKPIDVNALVAGMSELLHRTLGEPIAVETVLAGGLWRVEADPNQLENALLNLAVNARDAMPDGGKLTIETANSRLDEAYAQENVEVVPGQYVAVCVTDTGSGMSPEVVARVFEPFFTTKDVGRGTGLGLSMIYGFVKQSGGHVKIYSEEGQGTRVKLYLPRLFGAAAEEVIVPAQAIPEGSREEVILVVEDDDDVRAYSAEVLRELGYEVVEARDAASALRVLEGISRLDLLFTDVVLPGGMTGRDLADAARSRWPALKVLFTTGYARNAIVHNGRLDADVEMIGKPFTFADLAAKVRDVLDGPSGAGR
ncbi:ATP-binding protein [Methylobacterium iners]|uniref:histidine kinase n=1 Tax=Methylobacterium iners TaxID=418707 RepID=A0ABQ4RYJ9_9HYPH|nr:ATP-binding protein [Methylobacterium iners]GJD95889.1 Anti-sigma F factor [Methylobacterium iners]